MEALEQEIRKSFWEKIKGPVSRYAVLGLLMGAANCFIGLESGDAQKEQADVEKEVKQNIPCQPGAKEECNGLDDNCNGLTDEDLLRPYYTGQKGTAGLGTCLEGIETCSKGKWEITKKEVISSQEICDGKDNNCDGLIDNNLEFKIFYEDKDKDTYGNPLIWVCESLSGFIKDNSDCDDNNPTIYQTINCKYNGNSCGDFQLCLEKCPNPPAEESCDGKDNNCDGSIDEDLTTQTCYSACGSGLETCINGAWKNCSAPQPSEELCDGKDNNCDGKGDEGCEFICWDKTFGGSKWDEAYSIQQTTDGGYIAAGEKNEGLLEEDVWILKLNPSGELEWDKTFGGSEWDYANSIQQTNDGGYIAAGSTYSNVGWYDARILKLDSKGDLEWDKTFGGSDDDWAYSIQQTTDGGYIAAGYTRSKGAWNDNAWILKLDSNGNLKWDKTFGGDSIDQADSIQQTGDGGYVVAGDTESKGAGGSDAWVLKLDSYGDLEWDKTFGGSEWDYANSIQQTNDGGYIVAGWTESKGAGGVDAWILKLNSNGTLEWDKTFGGSSYDEAYSIQQTKDGGYVAAGLTQSKGAGYNDAWILKLDSKGALEWDETYGGSSDDYAHSIQQTKDGGYIVAGYIESKGAGWGDIWVIKLDENGEVCK